MQDFVMYFHAEKELLLDNNVGVSRYDAETHSFIPVEPLQKQELLLLSYLMALDDILLTKKMLMTLVWRGRIVGDNSVHVSISRLRKKLRLIDPAGRCLQTIRNAGFIFSTREIDLIPITSLDFLLSTLQWSRGPTSIDESLRLGKCWDNPLENSGRH